MVLLISDRAEDRPLGFTGVVEQRECLIAMNREDDLVEALTAFRGLEGYGLFIPAYGEDRAIDAESVGEWLDEPCLLYTSPSPRDA